MGEVADELSEIMETVPGAERYHGEERRRAAVDKQMSIHCQLKWLCEQAGHMGGETTKNREKTFACVRTTIDYAHRKGMITDVERDTFIQINKDGNNAKHDWPAVQEDE